MLSHLVKLNVKQSLKSSKLAGVFNQRFYSDDNEKLVLSEPQPPIPPNLGFPGDENHESVFKMRQIKASFKHGNPPFMKKKFIKGPLVIRLQPVTNCSNRRFFRFAVTHENYDASDPYIEDLGSVDPMPNKENQILVALNIERIKYYLSRGVPVRGLVGPYLGLAGLLPVHPDSYLKAFRNRKQLEKNKEEKKDENE